MYDRNAQIERDRMSNDLSKTRERRENSVKRGASRKRSVSSKKRKPSQVTATQSQITFGNAKRNSRSQLDSQNSPNKSVSSNKVINPWTSSQKRGGEEPVLSKDYSRNSLEFSKSNGAADSYEHHLLQLNNQSGLVSRTTAQGTERI